MAKAKKSTKLTVGEGKSFFNVGDIVWSPADALTGMLLTVAEAGPDYIKVHWLEDEFLPKSTMTLEKAIALNNGA